MDALTLAKPRPVETATLRILLLEHSSQDAESILQELRAAGIPIEPSVATTRREFLEAISSGDFAVVLSAYQLPGWNGMEALHELRGVGKQTPFILVTGVLGEDAAVECVKQGVSDYVLKSRLVRLPMALQRALEEQKLRGAREELRRALIESEARDRELIDNSVYGVFRASFSGSFLAANPALLEILACPSLQTLQSLSLGGDVFRFPESWVKLLAACRENGLVHSAEAEWRRKDGGFVSVKLHLRYVSVPRGDDQVEGIVEDVTELRALEHQLLQAQKFEAIGQLAGGIAHDFNNVVGAILGWAELGLDESHALPGIAGRFARIREQAGRAAALTRELLAFARCQALQPRPLDLNSIIRNLATFLDKVIGRDIEMEVTAGDLLPVQVDPAQIEQVLMNLCLNARDAMPHGGRLLIGTEMVDLDESYCHLFPCTSPGRYAVLSVSDTGVGMSQETRDRIFEPFFTTKQKGKGTGMGLATAYGIIKQHGGFIHVYSELGQGTLFRVYLPAINPTARRPAPESTEFSRSISLEGTETVLLAEDHDSIREMVRQSLAGLGYRVLCAPNGEEALRLCEHESPALAILDMVMPHMGGPATAAKLRVRFPDLPILFTSGYCETQGEAIRGLRNSSYLQKPYSPTSLSRAVRQILDPLSVSVGPLVTTVAGSKSAEPTAGTQSS